MFSNRALLCLFLAFGLFILFNLPARSGTGKNKSGSPTRMLTLDSLSTQLIQVNIGNGSGSGEEIFYETLNYLPHSQNLYSIYNGFLGINFTDYYGETHQSRYIDRTYNIDGELIASVSDPMDYETTVDEFRIDSGFLLDPVPSTEDTISICQKSYLRPNAEDSFLILEYTLYNNSDSLMESGKVLFFTDFDVGDGIYDNFTALEASLNLIYQYSDNDDYAGLAFLYPDTIPFQFGNFQDWFFEGTDAKIDSILMNSFQADTSLYDTTFEVMTGDYSSYIVLDIGDVPAGQQKTVTFAFAIQENLDALNFQIETARDYYINQLLPLSIANPSPPRNLHSSLSLYPNPFNSQAVINFNLNSSGFGKIQVYNQSGQLVKSLFNGYLPQGFHQVKWENGGKSGSGIYFLRAEFPGTSAVKKVILIK